MRRLVLAAMVATAAVQPAAARRDRTVTGDVIRAARYLQSSRIEDARGVLAELVKRVPGSPEVAWLEAELAFQSGDYARATALLAKLPDNEVDGLVGQTKKLAASTLGVTETFVDVPSKGGHFLIRHAPGPDAAIAELAGEVLEAARTAIGADLGLAPTDPIRVELLGTPSDLAKLSPLTERDIETTGTIALAKYNKLMVVSPRATIFGYPWMDTLAHEYTHLVVSRLSHDSVPVWLQEGLARFEQTRWRTGPGLVLSATEHALLAAALKKGRLITLDEMHPSMAKLPSQEAAALAYAEVYSLVAFIHGKVGYEGLRNAIALQRDGKSARRAVGEALGMAWSAVDKAWQASLKATSKASDRTARVGKPIRFNQGGKSSENVGIEQVSAKARKHARIGGMLRARGMLEAAVVEYEKALAVAGGGERGAAEQPFVAGKLARTLVELGRHDRAIQLATPLVAADTHDAVAAVTLGMARTARQEWPEAALAYEYALRISPFDPNTRCGLAEAYSRLSDARATREQSACDLLKR